MWMKAQESTCHGMSLHESGAIKAEGARERRTKEFRVPSPLMGEGEDEGGFLNCSRFTLHSSRYFQDRPSCYFVAPDEG